MHHLLKVILGIQKSKSYYQLVTCLKDISAIFKSDNALIVFFDNEKVNEEIKDKRKVSLQYD